MLVCPHCRSANPEGATVCTECDRELKPGVQTLTATRREVVPELDVTPPPPGKAWPRIVGLLVVASALAGLAAWLALKPSPCDGKFSSAQFDYCVSVPEGWATSAAKIGSTQVDQFVHRPAVAFVVSVDLVSGTSLKDYASIARTHDRDAGLVAGPARDTRVDGVPALQWDLSSSKGSTGYRGFQVVTVQDDTGWTVQLNGTTESLDASLAPFRSMLSSWHFR